MTHPTLARLRIASGVYEAAVTGPPPDGPPPEIEVVHAGRALPDVALAPAGGGWTLRAALPAACIDEGVQGVVVRDRASGDTLDSFAVAAGAPLNQDLRSEIAMLRAELDLLKTAFRRHCRAAGGG